jgi:hypothetical protein
MNQWDRDNLVFFLTVDSDTYKEWYAQATAIDKDYASTLLSQYSQELDARAAMAEDTVKDLITAKTFLQKFRLNS